MRRLLIASLLLGTLACASISKTGISTAPIYTEQSSWLSRQYALGHANDDLSATYTTQLQKITDTHYHFAVQPQGQSQSDYTIRLRRSDLAIEGFFTANGKELQVYLPLLRFPLKVGKTWKETLRIQAHPRSPVKEIPATFEVKALEYYDYVPGEKLAAEKRAFLILVNLPNQVLTYHYIPADKKFPGTNLIDLYLQLDFININAPRMKNEVLEYQR